MRSQISKDKQAMMRVSGAANDNVIDTVYSLS